MRNKILSGLIILCFCVLCYSVYKLVMIYNEYCIGERTYDNIVSSVVSPAQQELKPATPIVIDFDMLMNTNNLVMGWLYYENTPINYPVAQGKDNCYYLVHSIDGTYNISSLLI